MSSIAASNPLGRIWTVLGGDPRALSRVRFDGPQLLLSSPFDVTGLAATTIALATLAVAELGAQRWETDGGDLPDVVVDRRAASAAFRSEALQRAVGWELPPVWDPIAGNYRTADGWLRLHTNYAYHRTAALRALDLPTTQDVDREQVAARTLRFATAELEQRVVAEGGCAAALYTLAEWAAHPHGRFAVGQPAVELSRPASGSRPLTGPPAGPSTEALAQTATAGRPLEGIKVLDLTRVIAGPVCTRTLAAWGAQVLRIDPPGFAEVPALLPDMTVGKHCAALNLRDDADRDRFVGLLAEADVIVHGLRPGALAGLGYPDQAMQAINPRLCIATHDAYGWAGPWAGRRGFDSLVQLSCGIAAASTLAVASAAGGAATPGGAGSTANDVGSTARALPPGALPAQALDHGTGYLLAAAVCRALTDRERGLGPAVVRASLVGTANLLIGDFCGPVAESSPSLFGPSEAELDLAALAVSRDTEWGPMTAIGQPGTIGGIGGEWQVPAGPLGRHEPKFTPAG